MAEAKVALEAARLMTRHAAASYDAGEASNMAKSLAADAAIYCVDQAIESKCTAAADSPEKWRWPTCTNSSGYSKTVPITREMILNHVARHSLGLPRSY